jgi:hypothetical protein
VISLAAHRPSSDGGGQRLRQHALIEYARRGCVQDLVVMGPVTVKLWAASAAPGTDFTQAG